MPETITIRPWPDPVIDTLGHDPRSLYVELYWLPTLGPTTLLLMRRLAASLDEQPEGFDLGLAETSRSLGLGDREGRNSPLWRSLCRLIQFDLACEDGGGLRVRGRVPPVNRRHIRRLPERLQQAHEAWASARLAEPVLETARRNARRFASTLIEAGADLDCAERALFAMGFHPAICRESAEWVWERHRLDGVAVVGVPPSRAPASASLAPAASI